MANHTETLPEGTDSIVTGAGTSNEDSLNMNNSNSNDDSISGKRSGSSTGTTSSGGFDTESNLGTTSTTGMGSSSSSSTSGKRDRAIETLRSETGKLSGQAADKARGLVSQGLERGSEALANVSRLIGDTAAGLDERLGAQYGDYARKAATTIEDTANKLASKDADELIEDTRGFVRKSPGIALAGAAVVGFALVRLVKSGLDQPKDGTNAKTTGKTITTNTRND